MADCRKCRHNYKMPGDEPKCNRMCDGESDFEPITNSMRIRAMSDEELADFINMVANDSMDTIANGIRAYEEIWEDKENTLQWLKEEV